jgi:Flp pilus assembly pilin Flp
MTLLLTRLFLSLQGRVARDERGATTVEYGMLLVGAVAIGGLIVSVLAPRISTWLTGLKLG